MQRPTAPLLPSHDVPSLTSSFTECTTLPQVRDTLAAMFQRPFYAEGQPRLLQQVRHLFSFAVAYLARAGAIGEHDEPIGETLNEAQCTTGAAFL